MSGLHEGNVTALVRHWRCQTVNRGPSGVEDMNLGWEDEVVPKSVLALPLGERKRVTAEEHRPLQGRKKKAIQND